MGQHCDSYSLGVCVVTLTALLLVRTMQEAPHVVGKEVIVGQGLLRETCSHPSMEEIER